MYSVIVKPDSPQKLEIYNLTRSTLRKVKKNIGFTKDFMFPKSGANRYGFDKDGYPVTIIKHFGCITTK